MRIPSFEIDCIGHGCANCHTFYPCKSRNHWETTKKYIPHKIIRAFIAFGFWWNNMIAQIRQG